MAIDILAQIAESLKALKTSRPFVPTGLMEPMIAEVGNCAINGHRIIIAQMPNKVGKTRHAVEIIKNIIWPNDKLYFDYPLYNDYPFKNIDNSVIKNIRIVSDPTHLGDTGAIHNEIVANWPAGKYSDDKHGKHYTSQYKTDTGWDVDIMTYEQDPKEFESKLVSFQWLDEPADPKIIGAVTSRMSKGGVILMTFTPVNRNAGAVLDVIDDLMAQGMSIKILSGSIEDNSIETGKLNSRGTMRGLMTNQEIAEYKKGIPQDEQEQRLYGRVTFKSGKVYGKMFDRNYHVRDYDLDSAYARTWNNYMIMDPHRAYYPAMLWVGVAPDEQVIVWNEWPTYEGMGNRFYDQIRKGEYFTMPISKQAELIKMLDGGSFGMAPILKRFIDPRFASATKNEWTKDTGGIIQEFLKYDVRFNMPPFESIDKQRVVIQEMIKVDKQLKPWGLQNTPQIIWMPHCKNSIRAMERHYYVDGAETEAEDYKDFVDLLRYWLAGVDKVRWIDTEATRKGLQAKKTPSLDIFKPKSKNHQWLDDIKGVS